ncbi:MAG: protein kinase [Planctomycetaceae bacterium]|nr:protein kinase [Planctomycetales bacterium]MCB9920652.1 protein kinase [Planctomycetaceae bacterium]
MIDRTCPNEQELIDYASGLSDDAVLVIVNDHISMCSACQSTLSGLSPIDDTFVSAVKQGRAEGPFDSEPVLLTALERVRDIVSVGSLCDQGNPQRDTLINQETQFVGTTLGQYRLVERLGQGGMGCVYKAEHTRLEKMVAVKLLADRLVHDEQAVARFDREMKAVGKVDHPNIVHATDAGEVNGQRYLAMEYVNGRDLFQLLQCHGPLRVSDACEVVRQAALGIQHAHDLGMIHRDLKPSNLMVTNQGQVKVLDLGLARLTTPIPAGELTKDFQVMGSVDFMGPEQALNVKEVDHRVDIYSLGCTLYALLCGRPPFSDDKHDSPLRKLIAHEHERPIAMMELRSDVPSELSAILDRALAKAPIDRFQSASQFADALQSFVEQADLASLCKVDANSNFNNMLQHTSDVSKHLAMTDTVTSLQLRSQVSAPPSAARSRSSLIAIGILAVASIAAATAFVLQYTSGAGTLVVEINGDLIGARIEGERLAIEDRNRNTTHYLSIHGDSVQQLLAPGNYSIKVENDASGLQLETAEFRITRKDRTVVRAYVKPRPAEEATPNADSDGDPSLAAWALDNGAVVYVLEGDRIDRIEKSEQLSTKDFYLSGIEFHKALQLTDKDFVRLLHAPRLQKIVFIDLDLTERTVSYLAALPNLRNLELLYETTSPQGLEQIQQLRHLTDLTVGGAFVGNNEVKAISTLNNIHRFTISGRRVTDDGLVYLASMKQLEFLSLIFTQVEGAGLTHLERCPKLWGLHLPYTPANDSAMEAISHLQELTWLNLGATRITDQGLTKLSNLPRLDHLELLGTAITDDGLMALRSIKSLHKLDLQETRITDACVDDLAAMQQLSMLSLGDRLSESAVQELRTRLPNCDIRSTNVGVF